MSADPASLIRALLKEGALTKMRDAGVAHFEQTEHGVKIAFWAAMPATEMMDSRMEEHPARGGLGPSPTIEEKAHEPGDLPDAYPGGSVPYLDRGVQSRKAD